MTARNKIPEISLWNWIKIHGRKEKKALQRLTCYTLSYWPLHGSLTSQFTSSRLKFSCNRKYPKDVLAVCTSDSMQFAEQLLRISRKTHFIGCHAPSWRRIPISCHVKRTTQSHPANQNPCGIWHIRRYHLAGNEFKTAVLHGHFKLYSLSNQNCFISKEMT